MLKQIATAATAATLALTAYAGGIGPDVVVSTIGSGVSNYGQIGGINAYAITTVSCNIGDANAIWIDCTNGGPLCNQHPVIAQNVYRLKGGRFEQVGMAWLKHGWCAADAPNCGSPYVPHGSCDWLGLHATDTYGSSLNGAQDDLGPRSEINPWTGVFPYPYINNWNLTGNAIFKRLQIPTPDIDPNQNFGAQYYGESQYIATDEAPNVRYNNVSWRPMTVSNNPPTYSMGFTGSTQWQQPAIMAWAAADLTVQLDTIDVPGDGRMILGTKVTANQDGTYTYEYALYNMNSDRAAGTFEVPVGDTVAVTNEGFHAPHYHSGEPYSNAAWGNSRASNKLTFATTPHSTNVNANAVRWSSLYNFRFRADQPPVEGTIEIGLFKPGSPNSVTVTTMVPMMPALCAGDVDGDGDTDTTDLNIILAGFGCSGGGCGAGDLDNDGDIDTTDLNIILADFGC